MKALISGLVLSLALVTTFSAQASAACANGQTKVIREWDDSYGNHGREVNTTYVCVNGSFYKNGVVPQYPAPCKSGAVKQIKEMVDYGNNTVEKNVTYVCKAGIWRRNGYVPQYPAACKNGSVKLIKEMVEYGNHTIEKAVPYTCVNGIWTK